MELSKRKLQKENTRKKIMEVAYRIYAENGFSVASTVIAREAGVSHGAIFAHFHSMDELLICLIQDIGSALGAETHRLADVGDNLEGLLKAHLDILMRYENFYIRLLSEKSLLPGETQVILANMQSNAAFHFSKIMEHEEKQGNIKRIPVHMMFNTWMGLLHYYLLNKALFSPDNIVLERYGPELITTFIELISV